MAPTVIIPLVLSVVTTIVVSSRSLLNSYAKQIQLLTRLDENVKVCLVGLEALRLNDDGIDTRIDKTERRLDDLERYLQLSSNGEYPHPFTPRAALKPD